MVGTADMVLMFLTTLALQQLQHDTPANKNRSSQAVRHADGSTCPRPPPPAPALARRAALLATLPAAAAALLPSSAACANVIEDYLKAKLRPDVDPLTAVITLLDARSTLLEQIASTPPDSELRFHTRALVPGFAWQLREVQVAAPTVAALATGGSREAALSTQFGGEASSAAPVDPVFLAVGQVGLPSKL
eukprot:scaffold20.g7613.t1